MGYWLANELVVFSLISSALIEPLVKPLVPSRFANSKRRSSNLSGSRLAVTALAVTALMAASGVNAQAHSTGDQVEAQTQVRRVAHKRPARIVVKPMWATQTAVLRQLSNELEGPKEAAQFENEAVFARQYKHEVEPGIVHGPGLNRGRRLDRLIASADLAFLNFGSARVLAAQPHS